MAEMLVFMEEMLAFMEKMLAFMKEMLAFMEAVCVEHARVCCQEPLQRLPRRGARRGGVCMGHSDGAQLCTAPPLVVKMFFSLQSCYGCTGHCIATLGCRLLQYRRSCRRIRDASEA
eukprot:3824147-Rhodomonas_salina.1